MSVDDGNPLDYCPAHPTEKLLTLRDVEFRMYFSIADEMIFCCPLLSCDYVRMGIHDRIFSQMEFIQMITFARQKAFQFKYHRYRIGDGK